MHTGLTKPSKLSLRRMAYLFVWTFCVYYRGFVAFCLFVLLAGVFWWLFLIWFGIFWVWVLLFGWFFDIMAVVDAQCSRP